MPGTGKSAPTTVDRSWTTGLLIAVAGLLVGVQVPDHERLVTSVAAGGLALLTVVALARRSPPAIRVTLFVDLLFLVFWLGRVLDWPPAPTTTLVCLVPVSALLAANRAALLRPAAPWLRFGRVGAGLCGLAAATVLGSVVALTVWALAADPEPSAYLTELRALPAWVAVLGVVGFALVNPIWEEALYRGVLLTELITAVGTGPALIIQAAAFGLAHLHGFPSGWIGVLLAGGWGLVLGIIRVRTGGIGLGYVTHVAANAAIGTLAVAVLG